MEKTTITIPNISCGHCVAAIKDALQELEGVRFIGGDPESRTIDLEWEPPATLAAIREKLTAVNYPPEG